MLIKHNTFIVTGGSSGLGRATVEMLLQNGANVSIFDLNEEYGKELVAKYPDACIFCKVNVCDENTIKTGISLTVGKFGSIHGLVNCAGISLGKRVLNKVNEANSMADFAKVMNINVNGTFNVLRLVVEQIVKQTSMGTNTGNTSEVNGVIINVSSVAAFDGQVGQSGYAASKGAIVSMTLPLARELAQYGIRVVTVAPGVFYTPMANALSEKITKSLTNQIVFPKRLGKPEEFAAMIVSIITQDYLNGETIRLDAGIRMQGM